MGGELKYEIGQNAYIKLVLHSLKHNTTPVNGILLGRLISDDLIQISDAIPLSHSQIGLLPTLEIALIQIEEKFGAEEGLSVVGYYHANERFDDCELSNIAKKIGDHIYRYFPQVALLLLDSKKLESLSKIKEQNPVQLYTKDSNKNWKLSGTGGSSSLTIKEPSANVVLLDYISSKKWLEIVDFDDHLDDISKDWLNQNLFK